MLRTQSNAQILGFLTTMPDLGNLLNSPSLPLSRCPNLKQVPDPCDPSTLCSNSFKTLCTDEIWCYNWDKKLTFPIVHENETCNDKNGVGIRVLRRSRGSLDRSKKTSSGKCLEDYVRAWVEKKAKLGVRESEYFLPFLAGAPRLVECLVCHHFIYPEEEVLCSVRGCEVVCHLICAKERLGFSTSRKFKCPQHTCFICKKRSQWRCVRCIIASHDKCAAWLDKVFKLEEGRAVCWRHPTNWRLEKKHAVPASNLEEVFCRLPLPYIEEEFKINITWKDVMENKMEPPRYIHIRRNVYLVKKKRDGVYDGIGCTNCSSICSDDCVCRVQCISCSKACHCSEICTNRPFRKEKKIKVIKTEHCGWGVEAAESINKGDFVIEYIGEVIDDALCEQRLWDMKFKGVQNFYMCEIRKDFTIDATFKGNSSRFLNHSCDPNCILEKWQVEGETRVGVFAARSIEVGEPLTYDYRFVQFGPEVKCYCGAPNCQGYLGTKRKIGKEDLCYCQGFLGTKRKIGKELCWGSKRRRSTACFAVVTV